MNVFDLTINVSNLSQAITDAWVISNWDKFLKINVLLLGEFQVTNYQVTNYQEN